MGKKSTDSKVKGAQENKSFMQTVMEEAGIKWTIIAAASGIISIMAIRALDIIYHISIPFFAYIAAIVIIILISFIGSKKNTKYAHGNPIWSLLFLFAAFSMLTLECTPIIAIVFLAILLYWANRKQKTHEIYK
jgi:phosphoglycerol transferase MdoB-like AlkP superfamily enzyme